MVSIRPLGEWEVPYVRRQGAGRGAGSLCRPSMHTVSPAVRIGLLADATVPNRHPGLPAREAFAGALFGMRGAYAERFLDGWYVLSADCGLLAPDALYQPPPESRCVVREGEAFRRAWAAEVMQEIQRTLPVGATAVFLAGDPYRRHLVQPLLAAGFGVEVPAAHLSFGGQLRWLKQQLA